MRSMFLARPLLAAALLVPAAARAQDRGAFVVIAGRDTICQTLGVAPARFRYAARQILCFRHTVRPFKPRRSLT